VASVAARTVRAGIGLAVVVRARATSFAREARTILAWGWVAVTTATDAEGSRRARVTARVAASVASVWHEERCSRWAPEVLRGSWTIGEAKELRRARTEAEVDSAEKRSGDSAVD
jgi:hypothetical protein